MATEQINQQLEDAANDYITGEEKQSFALTPILRVVKHAFIAGAEWQKEQSGWISVQKRLPTETEINSEQYELLFYGSKRGENKQQQGVYQGYFDTHNKIWMFQPAGLKPEFHDKFYDIEKFYSQDMWFVTHWILIKLP
jgi:hypothetical protein